MLIVDVCSWGDFDVMNSNGLMVSEKDFDLNKLNKEFIKHLEKTNYDKFIITKEHDYHLEIMTEAYFTKEIKEHIVYFKDNNICCESRPFSFCSDEYKKYLISQGFEPLNSKTITLNADI